MLTITAVEQLLATYRQLHNKDNDIFDMMRLLHVCKELGSMGYRLNADETDWLPPQTARLEQDYQDALNRLRCIAAKRDFSRAGRYEYVRALQTVALRNEARLDALAIIDQEAITQPA